MFCIGDSIPKPRRITYMKRGRERLKGRQSWEYVALDRSFN